MANRSTVPHVNVLRAQQHRAAPTEAEQLLWSRIYHYQLGVWFRRQIGNVIADFLAPGVKLIVEVDGSFHSSRRSADARRDAKLVRQGYRVLRLEYNFVLHHIDVALARIRTALAC
jgi:very-short-patch-repair endonuclease